MQRPTLNELYYVPPPTFIIPIFRAPTTTSTLKSTLSSTIITSTNKIVSAILKQENSAATLSSDMINQRTFENLVLTNTIVAAFCIILMVTLTAFLIFLLIPSIRRRWLDNVKKDEKKMDDLSTITQQHQSFHHFTMGPSRLNPLFEPTTGTTTTTQFGTLFQPHNTTATLVHPTIWTPMTPTSVVSTPMPSQQQPISSTPPAPITANTTAARPPLPSHPPTTVQRSPRKR